MPGKNGVSKNDDMRPAKVVPFLLASVAIASLILNIVLALYMVSGGFRGKGKPVVTADSVSSGKFTVADSGGCARAEFGVSRSNAPYLSMVDGRGVVRAYMTVSASGIPSVELSDGSAKTRAEMSVTEAGLPRIYLKGPDAKNRAAVGVDNAGVPFLVFFDKHGLPRLSAGASSMMEEGGRSSRRDASSILLSNSAGEVIWAMPRQ